MDTPRYRGSVVTYATAASEKFRIAIQYTECHNQDFYQKRFLYGEYISLDHRPDALQ